MNYPPHPTGDLPSCHHPEGHGILCNKSEKTDTINSIIEIRNSLIKKVVSSNACVCVYTTENT